MTHIGKMTQGFEILGVRLIGCDFSYLTSEEDQFDELLKTHNRTVDYEVTLIDKHIHNRPDHKLAEIGLSVKATCSVNSIGWWSIGVGYQAAFRIAGDGDVSAEQVTTIHGPAHVFAFAREFISDIARRALIRGGVYPPPWNFSYKDATDRPGDPASHPT